MIFFAPEYNYDSQQINSYTRRLDDQRFVYFGTRVQLSVKCYVNLIYHVIYSTTSGMVMSNN